MQVLAANPQQPSEGCLAALVNPGSEFPAVLMALCNNLQRDFARFQAKMPHKTSTYIPELNGRLLGPGIKHNATLKQLSCRPLIIKKWYSGMPLDGMSIGLHDRRRAY